jgi:hypothetical protein
MARKVYLCENPACSLGTVGHPGRFTGGIAKEQMTMLTGDPEPEHHGEGVCPNCATKSNREAPSAAEEQRAHIEAEIKRLRDELKEGVA